jgi:predicted nucleotidyltransferase
MTVAEAQHLETYVAQIVDAIEGVAPVAGAYVLGSALLGGFDPASSDLDVVVVVERQLEEAEREEVVAALDELPRPFHKLELVVYAAGAKPPAFELNYPDGPGEPEFWFVLDAALAQRFAGREWGELLQPVSEDETRRAAEELLRWAEAHDEPVHAARARHYLEHGEWITKEEARR